MMVTKACLRAMRVRVVDRLSKCLVFSSQFFLSGLGVYCLPLGSARAVLASWMKWDVPTWLFPLYFVCVDE